MTLDGVTLALVLVHGAVIFGGLRVQRREPAATLAWLLALVFLPGVGLLAYLLVGRPRVRHWARRQEELAARLGAPIDPQPPREGDDPRTAGMVALAHRTAGTQMTRGNRCEVLGSAAATYRHMKLAFDEAKEHIHVLFYIFQPDETGAGLRDHLARKAREGIAIRVLVDALGSRAAGDGFWAPLVEAGGEVARFGQTLEERKEAYAKLHEVFSDQAPLIALYQPADSYAMRADIDFEIPTALRPFTLPLRAGQITFSK